MNWTPEKPIEINKDVWIEKHKCPVCKGRSPMRKPRHEEFKQKLKALLKEYNVKIYAYADIRNALSHIDVDVDDEMCLSAFHHLTWEDIELDH